MNICRNIKIMILLGFFSLVNCSPKKSKSLFFSQKEFSKLIESCKKNMGCIREKLIKSSRIVAIDTLVGEPKADSSIYLKVPEFKLYSTLIPNGPKAKIFVHENDTSDFDMKVNQKKKLKIALLTGEVYLYCPPKISNKWKQSTYNNLLSQLSGMNNTIKNVLGK